MKNREWVLSSRPSGKVAVEDFEFRLGEVDQGLADGEILVRNLAFSFAPTMRNWMNEEGLSYRTSINLGEPIRAPAVFEVIGSRSPHWPVGSKLMGISYWQDYTKMIPDPDTTPVIPLQEGMSAADALGVYGLNSLTAYVGLMNIGEPKKGETLVVSGAAGSVGSIAAQVGKILGCRVIGIAGGEQKCSWLTEECGIDAAIDYKTGNVEEALRELCPKGIDIFFDNVGGDILQAVMANIAKRGRIIVCGQISAYDDQGTANGPEDMMKLVYWSVKIQGYVLGDYADQIYAGRKKLEEWVKVGDIKYRVDVRNGFENLPAVFLDVFKGTNKGALILEP